MLLLLDLSNSVSCVMFGRMMQHHGWHRKYTHTNDNHLLVFVISGSATFQIEEQNYPVQVGDVLVIPAGTAYRANTADVCEYYFFRFEAGLNCASHPFPIPPIDRSFSFKTQKVPHKKVQFSTKTVLQDDYQRFYQSIIACEESNAEGTFSHRLALDLELSKILLLLCQIRERNSTVNRYPLVVEQMLSYIHKHLTEPLTTSTLCLACGISPSYGARLFRKHFNTTITEYILSKKLYYACELMNSTEMNISQIASYLGFCDVYYFSKCFKTKYGKSPTQMFSMRKS